MNAEFIKHTQSADEGLRGHVPAGPEYVTPRFRFLFVARNFELGFLQTTPRDVALALLLTFGSAYTW